jgi:YD repeat-containing protein
VTDYCRLLAATKAAHTEGWLAYDPHHDRLSRTDRTDLPDTWRAAARSGETAGLSSWLDVVGGDSFCPDAADEQA